MERAKKYSLIRSSLAAIGLSLIGLTGSVSAQDHTEEPVEIASSIYREKFDLMNMIKIPYFFEGCEISARGWIGRGSVYTEAGCIGCREDLLMANTERLSDHKPTFAAWRDDLNTYYMLRNTGNGLGAKGKLTDRGGFDLLANPKPQTIATRELGERTFDLSLALSARLGHIQTSKKTLVDFNKLDCG